MALCSQDKMAREIFVRIAAKRIRCNTYSGWSDFAERCLIASAAYLCAEAKDRASAKEADDADDN